MSATRRAPSEKDASFPNLGLRSNAIIDPSVILIIPGLGKSKLNLRFLELRVTGSLSVPDAGDLDTAIPIIIKNMDCRLGANKVNFPRAARDKLAVCGEIARVNMRDFDVFFENFHSISIGR